jgi:hypothetical protein
VGVGRLEFCWFCLGGVYLGVLRLRHAGVVSSACLFLLPSVLLCALNLLFGAYLLACLSFYFTMPCCCTPWVPSWVDFFPSVT